MLRAGNSHSGRVQEIQIKVDNAARSSSTRARMRLLPSLRIFFARRTSNTEARVSLMKMGTMITKTPAKLKTTEPKHKKARTWEGYYHT